MYEQVGIYGQAELRLGCVVAFVVCVEAVAKWFCQIQTPSNSDDPSANRVMSLTSKAP